MSLISSISSVPSSSGVGTGMLLGGCVFSICSCISRSPAPVLGTRLLPAQTGQPGDTFSGA